MTIQAAEGTPSPNGRAALAATLAAQVADLVRVGDLEAARVASDALSRLLSTGTAPPAAEVVDLSEERRRREDVGGGRR